MKSEERHKLHQNALAEWLNQTYIAIKPFQNAILAVIIVLILAAIFALWWTSESASSASKAWTQFFMAFNEGNPAALEKVAEDNPGSRAAPAADIMAADVLLAQGCNMLFVNKPTANQQLNKAVELYQRAVAQSTSPTLRAQAAFGLAKAWEAMGKLDTAINSYTQVTTQWPDSIYARMSTRRLDDLKRTSTKEVYDKFARFEPKPTFTQPPRGNTDLEKVPEEGPVFTPGIKSDLLGEGKKAGKTDNTGEASKPEEKTEKPADSGQSGGGEKPADAQPVPGANKPVP